MYLLVELFASFYSRWKVGKVEQNLQEQQLQASILLNDIRWYRNRFMITAISSGSFFFFSCSFGQPLHDAHLASAFVSSWHRLALLADLCLRRLNTSESLLLVPTLASITGSLDSASLSRPVTSSEVSSLSRCLKSSSKTTPGKAKQGLLLSKEIDYTIHASEARHWANGY